MVGKQRALGSAARAGDKRPSGFGLLLATVVACYAIALAGPFQYDDYLTVAVDPAAATAAAWWQDLGRHVRPLLKGSFVLSRQLGELLGNVVLGHRLANLAIHLAVIALLFRLGQRLVETCAPRSAHDDLRAGALLAAAVFGLHPLATEAVSYVSARSVSLATLLACASLLAWIDGRRQASLLRLLGSLLLCAAAVATRESVAPTIALLVVAWETMRADRPAGGRPAIGALGAASPFLLLALATVAWMLAHERYAGLLRMSAWIASVRVGDASLLTALRYFAEAFLLLRRPNIDPAVDAADPSLLARATLGLAIAGLAWLAWRHRARRPAGLLGCCWVLAWLLPLYVLPVRHDAIAERHLYPAIWGAALPIAFALGQRLRGAAGTRARAGLAITLAVLALATFARNADYRSEIALWEAARAEAPDKPRVLNNLGVAYLEAGRWADARTVLVHALEQAPGDSTVHRNLHAAQARDRRILDLPAFVTWSR